jgi:hypothetical protein
MSTPLTDTGHFSFGRVVSRSVSTFSANFGVFMALGALLAMAPLVTTALIRSALGITSATAANLVNAPANLISIILTGAVISGALDHLGGKPISFAGCLNAGTKNFPAMFGISFLVGLGMIGGLILLVVPGLFLATAWAVAGPVWIAESPGVTKSIGRSFTLTKGHRWAIFGLILLAVVAFLVACFIMGVVIALIRGALPADWPNELIINVALVPVLTALLLIFLAIGAAAIYVDLSGSKAGTEPVASTFD